MAAKGNEQFLISMTISGKTYKILGDCHLVEMLNSDVEPEEKKQALEFIKANCHTDDFSEPCDKLPVCSADAGSDSPDQKMWNKQDTKTLFDIRSKKEKEFNSNKVHKSLWENIAKELSALGVKATAVQCMNKWKALKREYKKTVDNNAQTGSEKNTCPFFEQFGELYGHKSGTRPTYTLSSIVQENDKTIAKNKTDENDDDEDTEESKDSNSSECCAPQPRRKPLKRRSSNQSALLVLEEYTKRQEEYRKERLEISKQQHEEKMNLMGKLIDCLQPKQPKNDM